MFLLAPWRILQKIYNKLRHEPHYGDQGTFLGLGFKVGV